MTRAFHGNSGRSKGLNQTLGPHRSTWRKCKTLAPRSVDRFDADLRCAVVGAKIANDECPERLPSFVAGMKPKQNR